MFSNDSVEEAQTRFLIFQKVLFSELELSGCEQDVMVYYAVIATAYRTWFNFFGKNGNSGGLGDGIFQLSHNTGFIESLPVPVDADTENYKNFYLLIHQIWEEHLLVHRFEIETLEDEDLIAGSRMEALLPLFKKTVSEFMVANDEFSKVLGEAMNISGDGLLSFLKKVEGDIKKIETLPRAEVLMKRIGDDEVVAVLTSMVGHATAWLFFSIDGKVYVISCDRSAAIDPEHIGMRFYQAEKDSDISLMLRRFSISEGEPVSVKDVNYLKQSLVSKSLFSMKEQMSQTCVWASMEMIFLGILMAHQLKMDKSFSPESSSSKFQAVAQALSNVYQNFMVDQKLKWVNGYLTKSSEMDFKANKKLLSRLYFKHHEGGAFEWLLSKCHILEADLQDVRLESRNVIIKIIKEELFFKNIVLDKQDICDILISKLNLEDELNRLSECKLKGVTVYYLREQIDYFVSEVMKYKQPVAPVLFLDKNSPAALMERGDQGVIAHDSVEKNALRNEK